MFISLDLGCPKMLKIQKTTPFAAQIQKSHSGVESECIRCPSPSAWDTPKCRKCRKGHHLQQKCRKVVPRLVAIAFDVHPLQLGIPQNAENS